MKMYNMYESTTNKMREDAKDFAQMLRFAANCIFYYCGVASCNDCNNCRKQSECEYVPRLGETTRINCPLWEGEKKDESEN